ncbi:MAG: 30S ribosomal protein S1 [Candidatus Aminicenantales bacterium]
MTEVKKSSEKNDSLSPEAYEHLLDRYQFTAKELAPGKIIKGKIVKITSSHVLVDVGFKSEGLIPVEDFQEDSGQTLRLGAEVEAILERVDSRDGSLLLSKRRADTLRALDYLERAYLSQGWVQGKVVERIKSGFIVNVGIKAFLPDSHADVKAVKEPEKLVGNVFKFKVLKFDRKSEGAVLSRKLFLQDEREKRKRRVFSKLVKGEKVKGQVKSITNFGVFIDLGGVEGLLHISDMSWGKINHPSELFTVGQEVEVIALDFNEKEEKISLGYKQLTEDPWLRVPEKYPVGSKVKGKVVSLTDFGAFVELERGVEGLIHVSDLSWSRKPIHPKKLLSPGQEVMVTVLDINSQSRRISLGLKQASPHPLELLRQRLGPGSRVKGKITSLTDFGAFMQVEKDIEGLIHISDICWEKIKHPSEKLRVGQDVEAVILNIDVEKQKISLGIKQLAGDIWEDFFDRHKVGDIVKVKVVRLTDFGVFVEITPGIEGVVFLSELDEKRVDHPSELLAGGEEKLAKIIKLNSREKKISLSFRQAQAELQKIEYQKYLRAQDDRLTLGDIMKDQLRHIPLTKEKGPKKETP